MADERWKPTWEEMGVWIKLSMKDMKGYADEDLDSSFPLSFSVT